MKKSMFIFSALLLIGCDNSNPSSDSTPWTFDPGSSENTPWTFDPGSSENTLWTFVANEGSFGSNNGTVSMVDEFGEVYETEVIGDVVQSIEVYNNKLIVAINVSEKLAIFDISEAGLSNWVEVDLSGTPPREIAVVNGRAYVSCWGDSDYNVYGTVPGYLKVVNLETLEVETSIEVGIMPEGLVYDLSNLWVANSGGSTLSKIDVTSNTVTETIEVGKGPQNLILNNNDIYISRRWYEVYEVDDQGYWVDYEELHGSSMIGGSEIVMRDYGSGIVCGGSVVKFNDAVYRSYNGGIYSLDSELNLESAGRIGEYESSPYSVEVINNFLWFSIRGDVDENYIESNGTVRVLDSSGAEVSFYNVGIAPGDFAHWTK